jgi:pyridoxal phosphate enzyme (YggS family)
MWSVSALRASIICSGKKDGRLDKYNSEKPPLDKQLLAHNLKLIQEQILATCQRAGRPSSAVALIAVSKTKPVEQIRWCFESGQIDFGENYVQEANQKQKDLSELPIRWHFIGKLQKNKVKFVVGQFALIHSVDSLALAQKISQKAAELKLRQKILLEVNLGDESTKSGFAVAEVPAILAEISKLDHLEVAGLMALPPLQNDPELTRPFFRELKTLFESLKTQLPPEQRSPWQYLSMGTTGDFKVAIEEGANLVRVGTAIFGERETKLV